MDNLFENSGCSTLLARKNDPQTSKDTAEKMVTSGALSRQENIVLSKIESIPGSTMKSFDFTTKDIAAQVNGSPFLYYKNYDICRRRFSGLRNKGKIERTGEKRDGCYVWKLVRS